MHIYLIHRYFLIHIFQLDVSCYKSTPIFLVIIVVSFAIALMCVYVAKLIALFPLINLILFGKKTTVESSNKINYDKNKE